MWYCVVPGTLSVLCSSQYLLKLLGHGLFILDLTGFCLHGLGLPECSRFSTTVRQELTRDVENPHNENNNEYLTCHDIIQCGFFFEPKKSKKNRSPPNKVIGKRQVKFFFQIKLFEANGIIFAFPCCC